jgi:ABC-type multidrug transport system fused ATPase/permease subunit
MFGSPIDTLLKEFYKEHKAIIIGSLFSSITTYTIESVILPKIMANMLTNVADKDALRANIIKIVCAWGTVQASYAINEVVNSKIEPLLTKYITDRLINSVFVKYELTHKEIDTSIIFSKIVSLRSNIEALVDRIFLVLLPRFISIIVIIFNFYSVNKKVGSCALIVIICQLLLIFRNINKCVDISFDEVEGKDAVIEAVSDKFDNIHTISAIKGGMEKEMLDCKKQSEESMNQRLAATGCIIGKQVTGYVSNTVVFTTILLYTYKLYLNGEVTSENLATILLSVNTLFNHMYEITYYIPDITRKLGILDSNKKFANELFSYKAKDGKNTSFKTGSIIFDNVTFGYGDTYIFKDLSVTMEPGKIIALFGPSGSGKSSFVKLILNILQPLSGTVYIDGTDIKHVSNNCIKQHITYVSQNTSTLFNKTIYENLVYGYEDVPNIKDIIVKLFNRYNLHDIYYNINKAINNDNIKNNNFAFFDYNVGKVGGLLSGGQRQVIHLIRAVLNKEAIIYIFDEPTTALDAKNKNSILQLIKEEIKGKTVLIIAHDDDVKRISDKTIDFKVK